LFLHLNFRTWIFLFTLALAIKQTLLIQVSPVLGFNLPFIFNMF
jgi:hypothetical protein